MAEFPIENVGGLGAMPDVRDHNLPLGAWSDCRNVEFYNGTVFRAPVFKPRSNDADPPIFSDTSKPEFLFQSARPEDANKAFVVCSPTGKIYRLDSGSSETEFTSPNIATFTTPPQFTSCNLAGCVYIHHPNWRPNVLRPGDTEFTAATDWPTELRASALRTYKDYLVALNVSNDNTGVEYTTMVKTSTEAQFGSVPATWDPSDTSENAVENILNNMVGSIIDGLELGDNFMIYGDLETFRMEFIGGEFLFRFVKVFDDLGVQSQNCVVEVDGVHYVFGRDDIVMTDGYTKQSICDGRVRNRIFDRLWAEDRDRCFVFHRKSRNQIYFCYFANESDSKVLGNQNFNVAAVYNYKEDTWSFVDLPSATSMIEIEMFMDNYQWDDEDISWGNVATSFSQGRNARPSVVLLTSNTTDANIAGLSDNVYFYDYLDAGSVRTPPDENLLWPAFAARHHMDLAEAGPEIAVSRQTVRSVNLILWMPDPDGCCEVVLGSSDNPSVPPKWKPSKMFHPRDDFRIRQNVTGRFQSLEFRIPAGKHAELSGLVYDVAQRSRR